MNAWPDTPPHCRLADGVLQAAKIGAIVLDGQRQVVLWNQWMAQHTGLAAGAALGHGLDTLFPELAGGRLLAAIDGALCHNLASLLSQTLNKAPLPLYASPQDAAHGRRMQQAVQVMPLAPQGLERHCMVQVTDVSAAVARETRLRAQALELQAQVYADALTGIANRRRFDEHLETEFRRARRAGAPIAVLMIDVDFFKRYNDHYGHQRGDTCLTRVARALSATPERPADLLARYGGEEFAAVLPDTDATGALRVAERMRAAISALAIEHAGSSAAPHVTISVGLASTLPSPVVAITDLLAAADSALYLAKEAGRDRVAGDV